MVFIVLAIALSLFIALAAQGKSESNLTVAVVAEDTGGANLRFLKSLREINSFSMTELPREQALLRLRQDRLEAVVIIPEDFSEKIGRGEFRNTLEIYTSPSSRASATISEPLINAVMMLWMEEYTVDQTGGFLLEQGFDYADSDEYMQREQMAAVWAGGSLIKLEHVVLNEAEKTAEDGGAYPAFVRWYGLICVFYFVVSATWVLDVGKKSLQTRIRQTGTHKWKVVLTMSAASVTICLAGYVLGGAACCLIADSPAAEAAALTVPTLVYLINLAGVTLLAASLARSTIGLMFLAPVLTFLNGILSGLSFALPQWAHVLVLLSRCLPGRWLAESLSNPFGSIVQALVCALVWVIGGVVTSRLLSREHARRVT